MTRMLVWKRVLLATTLLLAVGCLASLYRWHYGAAGAAADGMEALTSLLRAEAATPAGVMPRQAAPVATGVPEILSRVQELASATSVTVQGIKPSQSNKDELEIATSGDFRDEMRFLARLETLPLDITAFDLGRDEDASPTMTISVIPAAKPAAPASVADYIEALTQYSAVRDPFSPGDPIPLANAGSELGDLSWTYHLSSISLLGAIRIATIDGRDYQVGDTLGGMKVTEIGPSSVTLEAPGKSIPQKLHFRRNPGSGRQG